MGFVTRSKWMWAIVRAGKIRSLWVAWQCSGIIEKFHRSEAQRREILRLQNMHVDVASPETQALLAVWSPDNPSAHCR